MNLNGMFTKDTGKKVLFWTLMLIAQWIAFLLFKELADVSQWVVQGPREGTMSVWYNRIPLSIVSIIAILLASAVWLKTRAGVGKKGFIALLILFAVNWFSGMVNPALMMRPRDEDALWVNVEEAKQYVRNDESVIVYTIDGVARAHADKQVLRPHVAGGELINGKDVVMTYCGLTNLGMAFEPYIDGERLNLAPMTQLENNLVMFDSKTMEPVQQIWGQTEADYVAGSSKAMKEVATFRMPFERFAEAYPQGEVFINDYLEPGLRTSFFANPVKFAYDRAMEFIFDTAIVFQHEKEWAVFPTVDYTDKRLASKEWVWGFNVGDDYVAYTEEFVRENGGIVNSVVGGKDVVLAYNEEFESLGIFYNNTGEEITEINFFGETDAVTLERVETVKAGAFWIVWVNFFPETDVNRA